MPAQYRTPQPAVPDRGLPPALGTGGVLRLGPDGKIIQPGATTPAAAPAVGNNPLVPDAIEGLGDSLGRAGAWASDRNNWIRVAKVVAGGALIIVGAAKLATPAAGAIAGAVPIGRAAGAVGKVLK